MIRLAAPIPPLPAELMFCPVVGAPPAFPIIPLLSALLPEVRLPLPAYVLL
jgi:hypothetical protein